MRGVGSAVVPALIAGGLAAGSHVASKGYASAKNRLTKARDYKAMLSANPQLKDHDAGQTQMVFNSMRNLAPSLSADPLVAGSFVRNMPELSPESGPAVPLQTAKLLTDSQKAVSQARGDRPIADAFSTGKPMMMEPFKQQQQQLHSEVREGYKPQDTGEWGTIGRTEKTYR